jgi:ubiquinone/menaquinone biosynthesis C-methylase UbiE
MKHTNHKLPEQQGRVSPHSHIRKWSNKYWELNHCRALIRQKGWMVELFLGNGEELPFKENSFASLFHNGGINFFNHLQQAIDEMIRAAKPGTKLITSDNNESYTSWDEKILPG